MRFFSLKSDQSNEPMYWLERLFWVLAAGFVPILIFAVPLAFSRNAFANTFNILGVGLLTAVGAAFAGALLGLIFGVPVERQASPAPEAKGGDQSGAKPAAADESQSTTSPLRQSTKFQEIADWMTKIIIGLGLIELAKIPDKIKALAGYVGRALGGSDTSNAFALGIMGFYFVGGFCFGYIWADVVFPKLLRAAYPDLQAKVRDLEQQVRVLMEEDAVALGRTEAWLSQPDDNKGEQELKEAIKNASPTARHLVFNQAYELDRPGWDRPQRMRRRLPIFEALVEKDKRGEFHRNRGQLGVALVTCELGKGRDLDRAIGILTEAIEKRAEIPGWRNYEFYRAYALILKNGPRRFLQEGPAKETILKDLSAAWENDSLLKTRIRKLDASAASKQESRDEYLLDDLAGVAGWLQTNAPDLIPDWTEMKKAAEPAAKQAQAEAKDERARKTAEDEQRAAATERCESGEQSTQAAKAAA